MKKRQHRRNFWGIVLAVGLSLSLAACGGDEEIVRLPLPSEEVVPPVIKEDPKGPDDTEIEEIPAEEVEFTEENLLNGVPIVGVRYEKDGMFQSYLTGEWKDYNVATRRAIALVMPNNKPALPHYGISRYSIMFEAAVEGRTSRLVAFYEDYDDLERIGPVRSARDYFVYEAIGKNAIFCNWGLAIPYVSALINSDKVDNVSVKLAGIEVGADEAFARYSRPDHGWEYTGYLVIDGYTKAVERLGYRPTYSSTYEPQFIFAAENTRVEYIGYPDVKVIRPGGTGSNAGGYGNSNPYFEYNEDEKIYYRFQSGQKLVDELNNEQVYCSNVVFQITHGEKRDANDYLAFAVHGEGDAIVFTNGKMIEGRWERYGGDATPAKFYDLEGNEIILNQGKTWICLIWDTYAEYIVLE